MAEERIFFPSEGLRIEGLLEEGAGEKAVVITHPHPLYGGDMHNNVVEAMTAAYRKAGYTTLRFNFRGVGQSEGQYGEGIGEQKDVEAALAFLRAKGGIDLAGYSFGAWVIGLGLERYDSAERVIMVSPPVTFIDFSSLGYDPRIRLVIAGSHDEFGRPDMIQEMVMKWNPEAILETIQGADHFYWGKTGEVQEIIGRFLEKEG